MILHEVAQYKRAGRTAQVVKDFPTRCKALGSISVITHAHTHTHRKERRRKKPVKLYLL
jgi:hypothetical protein